MVFDGVYPVQIEEQNGECEEEYPLHKQLERKLQEPLKTILHRWKQPVVQHL